MPVSLFVIGPGLAVIPEIKLITRMLCNMEHGMARYGTAWHGVAWRGVAWRVAQRCGAGGLVLGPAVLSQRFSSGKPQAVKPRGTRGLPTPTTRAGPGPGPRGRRETTTCTVKSFCCLTKKYVIKISSSRLDEIACQADDILSRRNN